jgi:penicillin-binding protein 1A
VAMMNQMMQETLLTGTARKAELPGWQAAGKTGTSQDWRDAWFLGYTSYLVAGVWLGNDDSSPTKKVSGGNLPVEIWSRFMKAAHEGVPVAGLPAGAWRVRTPRSRRRSTLPASRWGLADEEDAPRNRLRRLRPWPSRRSQEEPAPEGSPGAAKKACSRRPRSRMLAVVR